MLESTSQYDNEGIARFSFTTRGWKPPRMYGGVYTDTGGNHTISFQGWRLVGKEADYLNDPESIRKLFATWYERCIGEPPSE